MLLDNGFADFFRLVLFRETADKELSCLDLNQLQEKGCRESYANLESDATDGRRFPYPQNSEVICTDGSEKNFCEVTEIHFVCWGRNTAYNFRI